MCCCQILLWTSKCSLRERMHEWVLLVFFVFFFGIKMQQRSGIWPSMNKAFHSLISFFAFSVGTRINDRGRMVSFTLGEVEGEMGILYSMHLPIIRSICAFIHPPAHLLDHSSAQTWARNDPPAHAHTSVHHVLYLKL